MTMTNPVPSNSNPAALPLLQLIDSSEPAGLAIQPRTNRPTIAQLRGQLKSINLPIRTELIPALVFLWHDYYEESHNIAQDDSSTNGSLLHAIIHRREPDSSNAKYWLRRVGTHPVFSSLARQAPQLLQDTEGRALLKRLIPGDAWDPFAFVDLCSETLQNPKSTPVRDQLINLQKLEFKLFFQHLFSV